MFAHQPHSTRAETGGEPAPKTRGRPKASGKEKPKAEQAEPDKPVANSGKRRGRPPVKDDSTKKAAPIAGRKRGRAEKATGETSEAPSKKPKLPSSLPAKAPKSAGGQKAAPKEAQQSSRPAGKAYWLMKAEPEAKPVNGVEIKFSIDDLKRVKEPEPWTGVRNHVAKKNMMNMKLGDLAFFYHSNAKPSGIAGIMRIAEEATVDGESSSMG